MKLVICYGNDRLMLKDAENVRCYFFVDDCWLDLPDKTLLEDADIWDESSLKMASNANCEGVHLIDYVFWNEVEVRNEFINNRL